MAKYDGCNYRGEIGILQKQNGKQRKLDSTVFKPPSNI